MGLGRRKIGLDNGEAWVFNRMAHVYDARPDYPESLVDALAALAGPDAAPIGDVGAGTGHLALPLAQRGFGVVAVEPALAMLDRLRAAARQRDLTVRSLHATAEALPLEDQSLGLVIIADALHFLDAERTACEIARVLAPGGALALVSCELGDTPFMRAVVQLMQEAAPRRPRDVTRTACQVAALTRVSLEDERRFDDATPVDHATLERILRSISYIGPAMNRERFEAFFARIRALPFEPVWTRRIGLRSGRRRA